MSDRVKTYEKITHRQAGIGEQIFPKRLPSRCGEALVAVLLLTHVVHGTSKFETVTPNGPDEYMVRAYERAHDTDKCTNLLLDFLDVDRGRFQRALVVEDDTETWLVEREVHDRKKMRQDVDPVVGAARLFALVPHKENARGLSFRQTLKRPLTIERPALVITLHAFVEQHW